MSQANETVQVLDPALPGATNQTPAGNPWAEAEEVVAVALAMMEVTEALGSLAGHLKEPKAAVWSSRPCFEEAAPEPLAAMTPALRDLVVVDCCSQRWNQSASLASCTRAALAAAGQPAGAAAVVGVALGGCSASTRPA